jgi:hypothetical protein
MADAASLRAQQFALSRHLRDPGAAPPPEGIEDRRVGVYRDLLRNNIRSLLAGNFPVIRRTLDEARWDALVQAFFAGHRSRTPLFTEIGREFIAFLEARAAGDGDDPPWLAELAHYEWVELALQISDALPPTGLVPEGDLLHSVPVVSPQAWALAYRWPVHRIGPDYWPQTPPQAPTLLLVRRDASGEIRFAQLSPLAFRLLEMLAANDQASGRDLLRALATEAGAADIDAFVAEGAAMLARMRDEGTVLGTRPPG